MPLPPPSPPLRICLAILASLWGLGAPATAGFDDGGPLQLKRLIAANTGNPAEALTRPVFLTAAPGDADRIFIVEKRDNSNRGNIRIYRKSTGTLSSAPFLAIPGVNGAPEDGLLGLAFHPNYADDPGTAAPSDGNGHFYVYFTGNDGTSSTFVRRYTVSTLTGSTGLENPPGTPVPPGIDLADAGSAMPVLRFPQPQGNHNGGWISFNPAAPDSGSELDNQRYFLSISSGDGGGGNDTGTGHTTGLGNGQDTSNLLGKILRLDVGKNGAADSFPGDTEANYAIPSTNPYADTDGGATVVPGRDEIFVYGLRHPWRCSFDRLTGDLYVADVGQSSREELNCIPAALQSVKTGNRNLGWRLREGTIATPASGIGGTAPPDHHPPIFDYPRNLAAGTPVINGVVKGNSVTGGCVYRGSAMPWLQGTYFFADYVNSRIWSLRYDSAAETISEFAERSAELVPDAGSRTAPGSFGQDAAGEVYLLTKPHNSHLPGAGELFLITQDPYRLWKNAGFSTEELLDDKASGDSADLDGDGKTTLEEFAVGHDPAVADGPLPLVVTRESDGGTDQFLTLQLPLASEASGIVDVSGESGGSLADFGTATTTVLLDLPTLFKFRDNVPLDTAAERFGRFRFDLLNP